MRFFFSQLKTWFFSACVCKCHADGANPDQLIERLSHELRTSLTGIVGYSEFVESTSTEPMVNFTAKIIRESSQGLARTSNSFFDLHRLSERKMKLKLSSFSISKLVRDVVRDHQKLALEREVNLFFTCTDGTFLVEMKSDEQRVRQVIDALVFAAVQQVGKEQSVHVDVSFDEDKNYVQFILNSSAVVIDHTQINLFKEFWANTAYTFRLQEGPGVELALARALIRFMNGHATYDALRFDDLIQLVVNLPMHDGQSKVVRV
jgi:signal transduction histidine kinase